MFAALVRQWSWSYHVINRSMDPEVSPIGPNGILSFRVVSLSGCLPLDDGVFERDDPACDKAGRFE